MIVIGGSSSRKLADDLARELGTDVIQATSKRFPDGECYIRLEREGIERDVVIVQNSHPDDMFVELLLLQDAAARLGAEKITNVIPYFGYARQDKLFNKGEAVSAAVMVEHIEMRADKVITVDIHSAETLDWFKIAKGVDVHATSCIGSYFSSKGIDLVLAPDEGAAERAEGVAKILGCDWDHLVKTRLSGTEVRITPKRLDVKGKSVLIVDDIISTGGTIEAATKQLRSLGARRIVAVCTHGLFTMGALERLRKCCDAVLSTNTLENEVSEISVAPAIAKAI
ncbi:MAG: ribose-phosphate diphosphokinase [Methanomassiliicoccales archaeon]|nr:ribose-phosphate diphosphokinase [Methanomassiliicoccales archaeon]